MIIVISSHRYNFFPMWDTLLGIKKKYPDAIIRHGGAIGGDTVVRNFCAQYGMKQQIYRPDYDKHNPKLAPLIRNEEMLDGRPGDEPAGLCVAFYDGRDGGGVAQTIWESRKRKRKTIIISPKTEKKAKKSLNHDAGGDGGSG
jgi:SLOG family YspA-like protein